MSTSLAIDCQAVTKTYHVAKGAPKEALKGIDLQIPRGSFFGLLGPNGAGKSTLINILAGLVNIGGGQAKICGHDILTDRRQASWAIGVVPQELVLDPFFTPYQVLENTAGFYGLKKNERRTDEIINAVGLGDKAHSQARSLSGGMRRRLLVAKALVHAPDVLVLDEPTAGVDVELRIQLWDYVRTLNEQGTTVLLTTHYLEEAQELCDHLAIINHGEVIANDSTKNIIKRIDQKCLTVTPDIALKEIPKELTLFNPTLNEDGSLLFTYESTKISVNDILQSLVKSEIHIKDILTKEADLEDVFRHLTKAA